MRKTEDSSSDGKTNQTETGNSLLVGSSEKINHTTPVSISHVAQIDLKQSATMSTDSPVTSSHGFMMRSSDVHVEKTPLKPSSNFAMMGFFLAGLFNNSSYVIMIAGAKEISPSMVGIVYVCNVVPSITVKFTGPYWYHLVSYRNRMIIATVLMALSFILVAVGESAGALWLQLLGVILGSTQSGFGEASYLALTAFYDDSRKALTFWSSGTGFAGIFGYSWVIFFTIGLKASFQLTLYVALILPVLFWVNFILVVKPPNIQREDIARARSMSADATGRASFSNRLLAVVASSGADAPGLDRGAGAGTGAEAKSSHDPESAGNAEGDATQDPATSEQLREQLLSVDLHTDSEQSGTAAAQAMAADAGGVEKKSSWRLSWGPRQRGSSAAASASASASSGCASASISGSGSGYGTGGSCGGGAAAASSRSMASTVGGGGGSDSMSPLHASSDDGQTRYDAPVGGAKQDGKDVSEAAATMTVQERLQNTLALWPFMIPLCVVYFAEYAMQAGVWAAIGFPVSSSSARDSFYEYANWMYQGGVLVSRSSGMLVKADLKVLWAMPALQVGLLLFFLIDAYYEFWYDWTLLIPCFVVGLLGGAVYVNGFSLISEKVDPSLKEFSLSAASLADGVGIALSTVAGIFIQEALYKYHDIDDDA